LALSVAPSGAVPPPGSAVAISIRPQEIAIGAPLGSGNAEQENVLDARIVRHAYLGEARDYVVKVAGTDQTLRIVTSARQVFKADENVRLRIPADACRLLPAVS
jgi:ABC-type Fe3+/spermidine/putrescine transport system ATPase subunit